MNDTLMYFFKVNIAIALFYLFYRLFFAGDTFWKTRRYYLLLSVLASFSYPLLSIETWLEKQETVKTIAVNYAMLPEFTVMPVQQTDWFSTENILLAIYGIGVTVLFLRMIVQLISIFRLKMQGHEQLVQNVSVIVLEKEVTPFSFFNAVFMNPSLHNEQETHEILAHELTHVRQMHSLDVIISELLTIACWFNPATWLLKREIRQNLEFLADDKVLESGFDSTTYQYHLLQLSYQTPDVKLGNKFNVSPLKKRIIMMNQQKTSKAKLLKYSLIVPLSLILIVSSNAQNIVKNAKQIIATTTQSILSETKGEKTIVPPSVTETASNEQAENNEKVYESAEKMPEYPGGEKELLTYLGANIKYFKVADNNNIQGMVAVRFVIDKSGKVGQTKVLRSVSPEIDNEAIRVVNSIPNLTQREQKGEKNGVYYTLNVKYLLNNGTPEVVISRTNGLTTYSIKVTNPVIKNGESIETDKLYDVVEKMPQYPGGEQALMNFISSHLKYPFEAMKADIQGTVIVRFIVNSDGKVSNSEILRGVDASLDKAGLDVVNALPDWIPGEQNDKKVSVYYTLPIKFKLVGDDAKTKIRSANGQKPLYIIDGKEVTEAEMKALDPYDFKKVDVLKESSATAIYGEKGKNGVILITTKK